MTSDGNIVKFPDRRARPVKHKEKTVVRRVRLPDYMWKALEADARPWRRSIHEEIEGIIGLWLGLYDEQPGTF